MSFCLDRIQELILLFDSNLSQMDENKSFIHAKLNQNEVPKPQHRNINIWTECVQIHNNMLLHPTGNILKMQTKKPYITIKHHVLDQNTDKDILLWAKYVGVEFKYPLKIQGFFVNASCNEYALILHDERNINHKRIYNCHVVLFSTLKHNELPKLNNYSNQLVSQLQLTEMIGYIGDMLLGIHGNNVTYFDKHQIRWIYCIQFHHTIKHSSVVGLPQNADYELMNRAVYVRTSLNDEHLYGFNVKLNRFVEIKVIDETTKQNVKLFSNMCYGSHLYVKMITVHERMFYLDQGCLYELKWQHNHHNHDNPILIRLQHLKWMKRTQFKKLFFCGEYGIAFTQHHLPLTRYNYIITFYEPTKGNIYRLGENDINLKHISPANWGIYIEYGSWFDDNKSLMLITNQNDIIIFKHDFLSKLQCFCMNNIGDLESHKSFNLWRSNYSFDVARKAYYGGQRHGIRYKTNWKQIPSTVHMNEWRSTPNYCRYKNKCYQLIAGYNCDDEQYPHLKFMKSAHFQTLSKIEELSNYLGAPIWYQLENTYDGEHIISTGSFIDFSDKMHLTKPLSAVVIYDDNKKQEIYLLPDEIQWIGVIDIRDCKMLDVDDNLPCDNKVASVDIKYDRLHLNEFYITKGRIICGSHQLHEINDHFYRKCKSQIGNAEIGKWHWSMKQDDKYQQLLAFHESVKDDKEYMDSWKIGPEIFEHYKKYDEHYKKYDEIFEHYKKYDELDDINETEEKYVEIYNTLKTNIKSINDDIIILISQYCHYVKSLNWIERKVLNNKWYLHRNALFVLKHEDFIGIYDYDHYGDNSIIKDPYENATGYDWYSFDEKGVNVICQREIWSQMVQQSVSERNPCSIPYGCVCKTQQEFDDIACIAKMNLETDTVVCIRVVGRKSLE